MNDADVLRAAASVLEDHGLADDTADPDELRAQADELERQAGRAKEPVPWTAGLFTRREAEWARNHAAELIAAELGLSERDTDLLALAGAVAAELIDNPGITLDEVIAARYDDSPAKVRSWWTSWT